MSHHSSEKYGLFRNYMTNELGITRADIEAWTKESVAVEVNKKLGQINVNLLAQNAITSAANNALGIQGWNGGQQLRDSVAAALAKQMTVTIAPAVAKS